VSLDAEKVLVSPQQPVLRAVDMAENIVSRTGFLRQVPVVPARVGNNAARR
jgi:hypothetical protein